MRAIRIKNYDQSEGECNCGCGLSTDDKLFVRLQAFIYILGLVRKTDIRHRITSGARCFKHNSHVGGSPDSQHLNGRAVDGHFDEKVRGRWVEIPVGEVANLAVKSKLFTGVGWIKYKSQFIHLDIRETTSIVTW